MRPTQSVYTATLDASVLQVCKDLSTEGFNPDFSDLVTLSQEHDFSPEDHHCGLPAHVWVDDSVIEYHFIVNADMSYRGAILTVTTGGPNITVDTRTHTVTGTAASTTITHTYFDANNLDDYMRDLYEICSHG